MKKDIREVIIAILKKKGEFRRSTIIQATGYSRSYVNKVLQQMQQEGKLVLVGKANQARYLPVDKKIHARVKLEQLAFHRILTNVGLQEDIVLEEARTSTGIFHSLPNNVRQIIEYGFTEMLNNAIEHSRSEKIVVKIRRDESSLNFTVLDRGIGIYRNIMEKKHLNSAFEAIQDLLKGKQTTAPDYHSGEGIFFTSKVADILVIKSDRKKVIFNNLIDDIFVRDVKDFKGTEVVFSIQLNSRRKLASVFSRFTGEEYEFGATEVSVRLYKPSTGYVSRSQARRILTGLEKFSKIILDFEGVELVGQAFADEVFRVWRKKYPDKTIVVKNANENTEFIVKHVGGEA
jgi:anti-sigma regulatory factor (Ser/Thr protein kinase)/biotin operon repressor